MLIWVDHHLVFTKDYCQSKATKIDTIQIQIMCTEARKHEQMHTLARSHAQIAPVDSID